MCLCSVHAYSFDEGRGVMWCTMWHSERGLYAHFGGAKVEVCCGFVIL